MKTRLFLLLATAGALAGCSSNRNAIDPRVVMHNDFETLSGWLPDAQTATITQERAHSGRYCLKVSAEHEFSLSFKKGLRQLFDTRPAKIHLSAWALVASSQTRASLVTTISPSDDPGTKPLLWAGLDLTQAVGEPNKWVKVSKVIEIPAAAAPDNILTIYLWGTSSEPAYLDDIVVSQE